MIQIEGYNLVRADHPDNIKRGGVCIYYKESLPVRIKTLPYFKEALLLEMVNNNRKIIVSVIYRSPSQNNCEFESFITNFDYLLSEINKLKPSLAIITGDFNTRSPAWWTKDVHTTEGSKLFSLTSANGFSQLINEPTHIQTNSSSCIDLIFTNQPNLSVNSGVHSSLHPNCPPLKNNSVLPKSQIFLTQSRLSTLDFNEEELIKIIRNLNVHKAHGHDDISIRMIKMCDKSILKPLMLLFENSTKSSYYPDIWKKSNIVPVHKKNDKQLVTNYRPISLLPIFGKIFEKIIFNRIYNFLNEKNLLNHNQSGFRPSDSCVNQLLSIIHEIFQAFDCNPTLEVRSVFLDISNAFDKVWHEGLLYKLKSMGISGELHKLLENYLSGRLQRVVLNGQTSS